MRVLFVIPDLEVGGTQRYVLRMWRPLRKLGLDVEICALERRGPLVAEVEVAGAVLHGTSFGAWTSHFRTTFVPKAVNEVSRLLRSGHFDAVQSFLYWPDVVASIAGRLAARKLIVMGRRSLHSGRHARRRWLHTLEAVTNDLATAFVANSQATMDDALRSELWLPRRRAIIYNGVDINDYLAATPGSRKTLRFICVANFNRWKDHRSAIRALGAVRAHGLDATLVLIGSGPSETIARAEVTALGLGEYVNFAGQRLDPSVGLSQADVFVLPSLQEGFSNALLEAMASGLAVVATDVGGNREAFVDGEGGRLVPSRDVDALAAALIELGEDRTQMMRMGEANRARVVDHFTVEHSAAHFASFYSALS